MKLFLRILDSLGAKPQPPHRALKFLATDFAGATFEEHCHLEMAVGEGFVLTAIYAFIDTLPEGEIRTLMSGLARQEEGHVNFGEQQTLKALGRRPGLAPHLLGLTLTAMLGRACDRALHEQAVRRPPRAAPDAGVPGALEPRDRAPSQPSRRHRAADRLPSARESAPRLSPDRRRAGTRGC